MPKPFPDTKLNTFSLSDLVGRTVIIKSFTDGHHELIVALDYNTGDLFILEEHHHSYDKGEE